MNWVEIVSKIYKLKSDEEIESFVKERIMELESNSEEKIIGQGYTDTFRGFIGNKVHYKAVATIGNFVAPDLVYDDINLYVDFVKIIRDKGIMFVAILNELFNFLNEHSKLITEDDEVKIIDRHVLYFAARSKNINVSIKDIFKSELAMCSERSGLVHNIFKIIGLDSELAIGYKDSQPHAYNIIFPHGYDNEPIFLYDPSEHLKFKKEDNSFSYGYFCELSKSNYDDMLLGKPCNLNLNKTEDLYRKKSDLGNDYICEIKNFSYIIGLNNNPNKEIVNADINNVNQLENGVDNTISNRGIK